MLRLGWDRVAILQCMSKDAIMRAGDVQGPLSCGEPSGRGHAIGAEADGLGHVDDQARRRGVVLTRPGQLGAQHGEGGDDVLAGVTDLARRRRQRTRARRSTPPAPA